MHTPESLNVSAGVSNRGVLKQVTPPVGEFVSLQPTNPLCRTVDTPILTLALRLSCHNSKEPWRPRKQRHRPLVQRAPSVILVIESSFFVRYAKVNRMSACSWWSWRRLVGFLGALGPECPVERWPHAQPSGRVYAVVIPFVSTSHRRHLAMQSTRQISPSIGVQRAGFSRTRRK